MGVPAGVRELARAKWASSGISDKQAKVLRLRPLAAEETAKVMKSGGAQYPLSVASLQIPYFDECGKPTKFYRLRFLEQLPGFMGQVAKPQRYWQPAHTLCEAYFPPLVKPKWEKIADDPKIELLITEGELKAAAAATVGLACVGLGGVDSWRAQKRGVDFLSELAEIKWKERPVVVVFDSDAATNPNVVRAMRRLSKELLARGAVVSIASIPQTRDGKKQGLDDLLVNGGREALERAVREAPIFPEAEALWGMNEEVLYVRYPGFVIERERSRFIDPKSFTSHVYSNRHYAETTFDQKGHQHTKTKSLARRWLDWEHRSECTEVVYEPGKPRMVDGKWNMWSGWGVEPVKGDPSPWKRLLDHLFGQEEESKRYFEQWCAYPLQHPGVKLFAAVMMWGRFQGTGKSMAGYFLKTIYGVNGMEVNAQQLKRDFNSWAENRQFVMGNEVTMGDTTAEKQKLKNLITQETIAINAKYIKEFTIRDCINYYLTANEPDALFVDDEDRRFFIHEVLADKAPAEFYAELDKWLNGSERNTRRGPGPGILFRYLLEDVDLAGFEPTAAPPTTDAKRRMQSNCRSDLAVWCNTLADAPMQAMQPLEGFLSKEVLEKRDLYTPTDLLRAFDPHRDHHAMSSVKMGVALNKRGIRQVNGGCVVRTKLGIFRLYPIRNFEKWRKAQAKEIAAHYEQYMERKF